MMNLIAPFRGLRPAPGCAGDLLAPPYDVMNTAEARTLAQGRPRSFLHVSRPEIDLPEGSDPGSATAYAKARENFQALQQQGWLIREPSPCLYVYRLIQGGHCQTGLAAIASVSAYHAGRIKKHELTRPAKEDDRVRHIQAVAAQTGPVFLVHRHTDAIDNLRERLTAGLPDIDVTAGDGVRHQLWIIADPTAIAEILDAYAALEALYIADGHHRCAAAARVADETAETGDSPHPANGFLAVIFPDRDTRILAYNRLIRDLNGLSRDDFLAQVATHFDLAPSLEPVTPEQTGTFGLYLDQQWYRLGLTTEQRAQLASRNPAERLDASQLQERLIQPILGIDNPRTDERIDFVGGSRGLTGLTEPVDAGRMRLAIALHPTSVEQLMAVADADAIMPPKSTWFEPKLADGLLCHVLS